MFAVDRTAASSRSEPPLPAMRRPRRAARPQSTMLAASVIGSLLLRSAHLGEKLVVLGGEDRIARIEPKVRVIEAEVGELDRSARLADHELRRGGVNGATRPGSEHAVKA